jgi:hypothetical protein
MWCHFSSTRSWSKTVLLHHNITSFFNNLYNLNTLYNIAGLTQSTAHKSSSQTHPLKAYCSTRGIFCFHRMVTGSRYAPSLRPPDSFGTTVIIALSVTVQLQKEVQRLTRTDPQRHDVLRLTQVLQALQGRVNKRRGQQISRERLGWDWVMRSDEKRGMEVSIAPFEIETELPIPPWRARFSHHEEISWAVPPLITDAADCELKSTWFFQCCSYQRVEYWRYRSDSVAEP